MTHYCPENIIGYTYTHGEIIAIYKPLPNSITTQSAIICCNCFKLISFVNGPNSKAVCLDCHNGINPNLEKIF